MVHKPDRPIWGVPECRKSEQEIYASRGVKIPTNHMKNSSNTYTQESLILGLIRAKIGISQ